MSGDNKTMVDLGSLRRPYEVAMRTATFDVADLAAKEPVAQFAAWFEEVRGLETVEEPNAMCLATASADGAPSARTVLLKSFCKKGFVFYTNGISQKGRDLAENPRACLLFYWEPVKRQVRVEGQVERLPDSVADAYFHSRPFVSRVGAVASQQSAVVADRAKLDTQVEQLTAKYQESQQVPRPESWGGYRVIPRSVEFWQGRSTRLHDRLRFRRRSDVDVAGANTPFVDGDDGWVIERLYP